jgi:hypothetical protein
MNFTKKENQKDFFVLIRETCPELVEGFVAGSSKFFCHELHEFYEEKPKRFFVLIREIRGWIFKTQEPFCHESHEEKLKNLFATNYTNFHEFYFFLFSC